MRNNNDQYVSIGRAAEMLDLVYDTVVAKCKTGILERININPGGARPRWRVTLESINKLKNGNNPGTGKTEEVSGTEKEI